MKVRRTFSVSLFATMLAVSLLPLGLTASGATIDTPGVSRLSGADRYETATAISKSVFPAPDSIFLAAGTNFPDALSAGPAAAKSNAPVLLTKPTALPPATVKELSRTSPKIVYVLGGKAAVSNATATAVRRYAGTVVRLGGANRYETSVNVSQRFWKSSNVVYLASGARYADALSGGALAAKNSAPVLLSSSKSLPAVVKNELRRLKPSKVVLLGGTKALTKSVQTAVNTALPKAAVSRLAGPNRSGTSAKVVAAGWGTSTRAFYTNGSNFPDALSGVPAAAANDAPLLLTKQSCMPASISAASKTLASTTRVLLGGSRVLASNVTSRTCSTDISGNASNSVTMPSSQKITLSGHGYGHGVGMSQYGAEGGARQGVKYDKILSHYYSGTRLGSKSGNIRVLLTKDTTDSVMVEGRSGLYFRNLATNKRYALPTTVDGKTVIRWNILPRSGNKKQSSLLYRTTSTWHVYNNTNWTGEGQFETSSGYLSLVMPTDGVQRFRGALRSAIPKSGATYRNTVNVLSIEDYTRGVVAAEMPASWHTEALKAQSVAARTYGAQSISGGGYYDICDTTSCQVYGGVARETARTDAAIKATAGKILTYGGKTAFTQFSSSSGGYTAQGSQPYLKSVSDPWDNWSGNGNYSWKKTVTAATIERAYPTIGTVKSLRITKRSGHGDWGGRVESLTLSGSKGSKTISGHAARSSFGLKSNWFGF